MKRTLSSGCSFTAGNWEVNFNGNYLHKDLSCPGAGNKYIADSVIHWTSQNQIDCVFVMWSGLTRLDIPTSTPEYFSDYFNVSFPDLTPGNTRYVMSGGEVGSWMHHPMTKPLFSSAYKVMSYGDLALLSLLEIIKLQNYLSTKNIPFYFMSYINYWDQPSDWISPNCDRGLNNYPQLNSIIDQIDFSNWIFLNDNKDGLFELAVESNSLLDDSFHPDKLANNLWFDVIQKRINQDRFLD